MAKTLEQNFIDWESHVFGFGYGTGEPHILPALKTFLGAFGTDVSARGYYCRHLEAAVTPTVAWLLINILCRADIIEYGTSPRGGWLTTQGEALKAFVDSKSAEELVELCTGYDESYVHCMPDGCNCGPHGYEEGRVCSNPFWESN